MVVKVQEFTAPLAPVTTAQLVFTRGVPPQVTIQGDPALERLLQAQFQGAIPDVNVTGGVVTVHYRGFPVVAGLLRRPQPSFITLSTGVPWRIEVRGGAGQLTADLSQISLDGFQMDGGAREMDLKLPRPSGTVPVLIGQGASNVTIHRPSDVPVRVHIEGGASNLTLDRWHSGAIGGEIDWETPAYQAAANRYEVNINGGVSNLSIGIFEA